MINVDPQQQLQDIEKLKQRNEENEKEYNRLMKFELKFELAKPQFLIKDQLINLCYLRGYRFDDALGSFVKLEESKTDSINFITNIELQIQGKTSFIKSMPAEFDIAIIQRYKVGIFAEPTSGPVPMEQEDEYEIGSVEFTFSEIFMSYDRTIRKAIKYVHHQQDLLFFDVSSTKSL